MNILFWNLHRNPITRYVKDCLLENQVDIAIFAEHDGLDREALARETGYQYRLADGLEEQYARESAQREIKPGKVVLLSLPEIKTSIWLEKRRFTLYKVSYNNESYILAGVHLQDRRNYDSYDRTETIGELIADINGMERETACNNIIIIGDFNANPYDRELLDARAFNAVLFKDIIQSSEISVKNRKPYRRFYNPILNFLAESPKNYGSYYYIRGMSTPVWHCLDQVLVSKSLMERIVDLKYIRLINGRNLVRKSGLDGSISDHLPLLVHLEGGRYHGV